MKNKLKVIFLVLSVLFLSQNLLAWDKTGHRIVGEIAQSFLNKKAKKEIKIFLGNDSLARVSVWADEIRSDKKYNCASPWHYVSIPDDKTYEKSKKNPKGDIIVAIRSFAQYLANKKNNLQNRKIALKFLIHFVGDIHQPLHVGRKKDRGGNDIIVKWFKSYTKFHRVWDYHMIELENLSFSEYVKFINFPKKSQIEIWQNSNVLQWASESKSYRKNIYNFKNINLGYDYSYKHKKLFEKRLLQAGVRLAGLLNSIFSGNFKQSGKTITLKCVY